MTQHQAAAPTPDEEPTTDSQLRTEQVEQQIREAERLHQQLTDRLKATEQTNQPTGS